MAKAKNRAKPAAARPKAKPAPGKPAPRKSAAAKKPAASRKPAPKQAAPKKAAPRKAAPRKAAAKTAASKAAAPKAAAPKAATPRTAAPKKAAVPAPKSTATKRRMPLGTLPPAPIEPVVRAAGGARVVEILEDEHPIDALRRFLSTIDGEANVQQGQIALGSAQLMLLPIAHEHRGGPEVKELLDLVLSRWTDLPDRAGFHAQEFLRNAFAAVGPDPERIARLIPLVPDSATAELRFNIACAYAVINARDAMLASLEAALEAGATPAQVRRDDDFAPYLADPDFDRVLDGAAVPVIPVDIRPHLQPVRAALASVVATLEGFGEHGQLNPPTTLESVLAAEHATKLQLPNDYRALLTIADGMKLWDNEFFGTKDYGGDTALATRAREYLAMSAEYGATGIDECIPLANWGQPSDWLLYDPRGTIRRGEPGYVLMLNADELPLENLVAALQRLEEIASDVLGTN